MPSSWWYCLHTGVGPVRNSTIMGGKRVQKSSKTAAELELFFLCRLCPHGWLRAALYGTIHTRVHTCAQPAWPGGCVRPLRSSQQRRFFLFFLSYSIGQCVPQARNQSKTPLPHPLRFVPDKFIALILFSSSHWPMSSRTRCHRAGYLHLTRPLLFKAWEVILIPRKV